MGRTALRSNPSRLFYPLVDSSYLPRVVTLQPTATAADSTSSGPATACGSLSRTAKEYRSGYQQAQQCQHHYHYYWEQYHDQSLTCGCVVHLPDTYHAKVDTIKRQKAPDER